MVPKSQFIFVIAALSAIVLVVFSTFLFQRSIFTMETVGMQIDGKNLEDYPTPQPTSPPTPQPTSQPTSVRIPKILHQFWYGTKQPPKKTMDTCKQLMPDWEYHLWPNDASEYMFELINNETYYANLGVDIRAASDIFRLDALYKYGGVYLDADVHCFRPFDELLTPLQNETSSHLMFAGLGTYHNEGLLLFNTTRNYYEEMIVYNGVIGATPGHPVVREIIKRQKDKIGWARVGPYLFTTVVHESLANGTMIGSEEFDIRLYPYHYFYPYHYVENLPRNLGELQKVDEFNSYCVNLWGTTKSRWHFL